MHTILLGLVGKISDLRENISRSANSVIDQLIDIIEPAIMMDALYKCIDSNHVNMQIATLEIMNVVAKNCDEYFSEETNFKSLFIKLSKILQLNVTSKKVINPILGLLLIMRDVNTKMFDSLLSKLPNQSAYQIIGILKDQDPELAKSIENGLKAEQPVVEDGKKKELAKAENGKKTEFTKAEYEKKTEVPTKKVSATELFNLLNARSETEILEALPQIKENPGSFYPCDPKTNNLFTKTIEGIFKIINSHAKVIKLCSEAYYTISELIIHNPEKIEKVYELVVYTCLGIAEKNEKIPHIWEGAMQVIKALLLTDSASSTYEYIIKCIEYSANSHAYIRALAALPSTLDKEFFQTHLKSLVEALKKETNIRKETVYCFVEYYLKFEALMTPLMSDLPGNLVKLIEIYVNKKKGIQS